MSLLFSNNSTLIVQLFITMTKPYPAFFCSISIILFAFSYRDRSITGLTEVRYLIMKHQEFHAFLFIKHTLFSFSIYFLKCIPKHLHHDVIGVISPSQLYIGSSLEICLVKENKFICAIEHVIMNSIRILV